MDNYIPKPWVGDLPEDDQAAWEMAKFYICQQGWNITGYSWDGPLYKPEDRYLTSQGWPLGTTCWYVVVQVFGRGRHLCCAATFVGAVIAAHQKLVEIIGLEQNLLRDILRSKEKS